MSLILFYLLYKVLFQQDSFFKLRRAYLLLSIGLSLTLPLVDTPNINITNPISKNKQIDLSANYIAKLTHTLEQVVITPKPSTTNWLLIIYVGIISILTGLLLMRLLSLFKLSKQATVKWINDDKIHISHKEIAPFSFFKLIILSKNDINSRYFEMILKHEKTHVKQWHSIDVIINELLCIVFFFNPIVYLLKKETRINLEYLADQNCFETCKEPKAYEHAILKVAVNQPYPSISNHFNYSPIKLRIMMLNKKKSKRRAMLKYLGILPMIMVVLLLIQCTQDKTITEPKETVTSNNLNTENIHKTNEIKEAIETYQFMDTDTKPQFKNGNEELIKYLNDNINYPKEAQENGIEGSIYLNFIISKTGEVKDVNILRASGKTTSLIKDNIISWTFNKEIKITMNGGDISTIKDATAKVITSVKLLLDEAKRVIKSMPKWSLGKKGGEVVNVKYSIPIVYELN